MRLTKLQTETLAKIQAGEVEQRRYGHGAWRIRGGNPNAVGRLISMGLAAWGAYEGDSQPCSLTDAGRQAISGLTDDEIEAIQEDGAEAGRDAWGPAGLMGRKNPYPEGSEANEIWAYAFRQAYAKEMGR